MEIRLSAFLSSPPPYPIPLGKIIYYHFPPAVQLLMGCYSVLFSLCCDSEKRNVDTYCQEIVPVTRKTAEKESACDTPMEKSDVVTT